MAQDERLITLKNTSDEPISDSWDAVPYSIAAGEEVTLPYGVGLHFREKFPALETVKESIGLAPQAGVYPVGLLIDGDKPVTILWDNRPYTFEPGEPLLVDPSLASALVAKARAEITPDFPRGASLAVVDPRVAVTAPADATLTLGALAKSLKISVKKLLPIAATAGVDATSGKVELTVEQEAAIRAEAEKSA